MQIIKILVILIFVLSCNNEKTIKNIYINKTQKIQVQENWSSDYKISYLWSKPAGPNNHGAKWIVNDNIMLFTPYKKGDYSIKVSIQNSMGEVLGEEVFFYHVLNNKNQSITLNKKSVKPNHNELKNQTKDIFYNIQISSWKTFEEAEKDMKKINKLGFDSYIDKKIINKKIWYRVRIGENLSYDESLKIKKQLEQQKIYGSWINKE